MAIESFTKQSSETFLIYGSILKVQEADETVVLAGSSVSAVDADGADASSDVLDQAYLAVASDPDGDYSANALRIRVKAGTESGSPYKVTFTMLTSKANTYEVDCQLVVRET